MTGGADMMILFHMFLFLTSKYNYKHSKSKQHCLPKCSVSILAGLSELLKTDKDPQFNLSQKECVRFSLRCRTFYRHPVTKRVFA